MLTLKRVENSRAEYMGFSPILVKPYWVYVIGSALASHIAVTKDYHIFNQSIWQPHHRLWLIRISKRRIWKTSQNHRMRAKSYLQKRILQIGRTVTWDAESVLGSLQMREHFLVDTTSAFLACSMFRRQTRWNLATFVTSWQSQHEMKLRSSYPTRM